MTLTEAFAVFDSRVLISRTLKTRKNYRTSLHSIIRAIGDLPIELIGEEQIIVWKQFMTTEGCTGTTQRSYLMDFRTVVKYLRGKGMKLIDPAAIEFTKNDTKPRPFLTPKEMELILEVAKNHRDKAIIACVFLGGTRISELLDLNRDQVDSPVDDNGLQEVMVKGKAGKYRPIYLNTVARHYLKNYLDTRKDRFCELFISGQNRRITVSRVEQIIHQCARDAGLDKVVTPHILRHSFATDLLTNGAPLYDVSKLMGHANIATTANIYGHYDTQARKQTLRSRQSKIEII